jgi:predicted peroxiredoxin
MKKLIAAVALTLPMSFAMAQATPVTILLSSGESMAQGMAMVLANQMQRQGAQVDILLCDDAGELALKDYSGKKLKPNNVSPGELLDSAIKLGATASVCALYLPNEGKSPSALKPGIPAAQPDAMAKRLLEPNRKVMGF